MLALLRSNYCSHCSHVINLNFKRAITTSQLNEYYAILNVNKSSTPKEIKESFLKLSKVYHPDNKDTGSHTKFVKLKEAYDAIKEGAPPVTSYSYTDQQSRYNKYADEEMNRTANAYYRGRHRYENETRYNSGFGGPFANSSTAWEDLKRDQAYRRQQQQGGLSPKGSFAHTTIFFSAIAWIFIYSGVLLIWEHNDRIKEGLFNFRPRTHADYVAYEEYLRRKERENLLRTRRVQGTKPKGEEKKNNEPIKPQVVIKGEPRPTDQFIDLSEVVDAGKP